MGIQTTFGGNTLLIMGNGTSLLILDQLYKHTSAAPGSPKETHPSACIGFLGASAPRPQPTLPPSHPLGGRR